MADLGSYLSVVNRSVAQENGRSLATLLTLPAGPHAISPEMRSLVAKVSGSGAMMTQIENRVQGGMGALVSSRLSALAAIASSDWTEANRYSIALYNAMLNAFREEGAGWLIPVVTRVSDDVRVLATESDKLLHNRDNELLREALRNLSNGFNVVAKVRGSFTDADSKKLALFAVTNVLFKIYFKLNTLQLCSKLINVVERPGPACATDAFRCFPVADVVAYKYYVGRLKMFEDRYEEARDCFTFALRHTPAGHIGNVRRILINLVPVQMCLGVMPGPAVADRYGLGEFYELGAATRRGDVKSFEEIMKTHQRRFIMRGVYLVLEQVKVIAYRNLFKKIYVLTNSTRLKLSLLESALAWLGEQLELDEIECILANLIYQSKIKGYLSHEKQTLIVSKADPFPGAAIIKR